jgi:hypothetical protein
MYHKQQGIKLPDVKVSTITYKHILRWTDSGKLLRNQLKINNHNMGTFNISATEAVTRPGVTACKKYKALELPC